jgi:hypothetical protein
LECDFRPVALIAQVGEHDGLEPGMTELRQQLCGCVVRQVSRSTGDAPTNGEGVRAPTKEIVVVVRLDNETRAVL